MRNQRPDIILGPQQQHEQSRVQLSVGWNNFVLVSDRTWSLGRAVDQEKEGEGGRKVGVGVGGEPWRGSLILILLLLLTLAFCSKFFLFLFFSHFFFWVCARPCPSWAN